MNKFDFVDFDSAALLKSEEMFYDTVYTPAEEAVAELKRRWEDRQLEKKIIEFMNGDIPPPFLAGNRAVIDRQLCTPNFEFLRFIAETKNLQLEPLLLEYHLDKFTSNNPLKHALGKMRFEPAFGSERPRISTIIGFNLSNGRLLKDVKTVWGQSLIDFHHELLISAFPAYVNKLYDASEWLHRGGLKAKDFYSRNTALFVRNSILFENYVLRGCELPFIKTVFIPNFFKVWQRTGKKPLIVSLLPIETQEEKIWTSYPLKMFKELEKKKQRIS